MFVQEEREMCLSKTREKSSHQSNVYSDMNLINVSVKETTKQMDVSLKEYHTKAIIGMPMDDTL